MDAEALDEPSLLLPRAGGVSPPTTPRRPRVSTSLRDSDPRRRGLSDSDSLTATPPKRASFEELRDSWVSMRRSASWSSRESAEVAAPDVSWSDSYVRVTDSGERFAPRVSFPLMRRWSTPSAILDRIDRLVPVLEPPRDHLEMWLDRRGLGSTRRRWKSLGARRVSDLALLEDDDLDAGVHGPAGARDPRASRRPFPGRVT